MGHIIEAQTLILPAKHRGGSILRMDSLVSKAWRVGSGKGKGVGERGRYSDLSVHSVSPEHMLESEYRPLGYRPLGYLVQ